ncbi:ABC transporter ATP-binding protein [[Clostridium] scindens]|uniref:ABC transporter ATP-binding protein n=1 Tax=Clostridium scindens (strain JCM 10418 / VPI 12708) TaxID=29347 RepID=UPI002167D5C9|nr:dipeptide ABC transporter ATP-binding protein [[Clostridium] scindens]
MTTAKDLQRHGSNLRHPKSGEEKERMEPLFDIRHVSKYYSAKSGAFSLDKRMVKAVDDISFQIHKGETIGIVGESGCGKTTLGKLILHLFEPTAGEIIFRGQDILKLERRELRQFRKHAQIVYQDPYTSLNPRMPIGEIIGEPLKIQKLGNKDEIKEKVLNILDVVGLVRDFYDKYPFECSGGQRQRVGIARALILRPELIVCDEAVSALDVSTQSQIINLLEDIQKEFGLTYLFISHGLSVVRHICSRVIVMYLGQVVEMAECEELYENPLHPYTKALFSAIPLPDPEQEKNRIMLEGDVPNPVNIPQGCAFHTRCRYATQRCRTMRPILSDVKDGHQVSCHLYSKEASGNKEENPAPAEV